MSHLRVAIAQLNPVVGDLEGNVALILDALAQAEDAGADVCVYPELVITGYPPEDLLLKPSFVGENLAALDKVVSATQRCVAVVGYVEPLGVEVAAAAEAPDRARIQPLRLANAAAVCAGGSIVGVYRKQLLPNYGVFDEARWFTPGDDAPALYRIGGALVGVSICEDIWFADGPVAELGRAGAGVVVNLNGSPYSRGRRRERLAMLRERIEETGCAIAYANQVGGQDELVFDGASVILDESGAIVGEARQFANDLMVLDLPVRASEAARGVLVREVSGSIEHRVVLAALPAVPPLDAAAEVYEALVLGTRDYLAKNRFTDAVIGLSGGIDSSLVATIAVDALGAEHVHGVSMPSRYSSEGSRTDAEELAGRLGISLDVIPIESAHRALSALLAPSLGAEPMGLTDENLQSRVRGVLLMAISNATGRIVLTTGNKSEMATGYSTLYGDSAGGFAVIKDVPKTLVYELCRYRNRRATPGAGPIPEAVIEKAPSAELRPEQRDDQSLPPYDVLDPVLEAYVEKDRTSGDLVAEGYDPEIVDQVVRLVDGAEYKRRQMPPGVRITTKAFGKDRRMPITNAYRYPESSRHPDG